MQVTVNKAYSKYFFASSLLMIYVPLTLGIGFAFDYEGVWIALAQGVFVAIQIYLLVLGVKDLKAVRSLLFQDQELLLNGEAVPPEEVRKIVIGKGHFDIFFAQGERFDRQFRYRSHSGKLEEPIEEQVRRYCRENRIECEVIR